MSYRISHAQNFEDVMLWRALGAITEGRYVDVGAQSPDVDSVSRIFHEAGWRGVHVDANADYAAQLRAARPGDVVVQAAVTDREGTLRFYEIPDTGLSTAREDVAARHAAQGFPVQETDVATITLDAVLELAGGEIHWLKIDVEGGEEDVLRSWRASAARPWIVVVESTNPLTPVESHAAWEPLLLAKDYRFVWFDGLNRFYVSAAHPELGAAFQTPPNLFDGFALSGSANSPFCRVVVGERNDARAEATREREAKETAGREAAAALEAARREALESLEEARQEAAASLQAARDEAAASLQAARDESAAALQAARDEADGAIDAQRREADARLAAERDAAGERERLLSVKLHDTQEEVRRMQDELQVLRERAEAFRLEAHRWWVEAEALRAQRGEILRSHSWRLTAPLRAIRRLVSQPRSVSRLYGRRALSFAMRGTVASPFRRAAQRLLGRTPALRERMRAIAVADGVIPGREPEKTVVQEVALPPVPGIPAQARRIQARLRAAMQEAR